MTVTNNSLIRSLAVAPGKPVAPPLKAERIQLILLALDLGNRPYDFANETAAERDARLEAGWRRRTASSVNRPRDERDVA